MVCFHFGRYCIFEEKCSEKSVAPTITKENDGGAAMETRGAGDYDNPPQNPIAETPKINREVTDNYGE